LHKLLELAGGLEFGGAKGAEVVALGVLGAEVWAGQNAGGLKAGLLEAGLGCAWGGHAGHASSALVLAGQLALGCT
jgi:hypothetical protein